MLSLTPPALHSLHSICSGGVSVSGGALRLSLDVCMCQQGGEVSDRTRGKIVVVHRALRVHTCGESCTGKGEMHFRGSVCFILAPGVFVSLRFWPDCVEPCLCL